MKVLNFFIPEYFCISVFLSVRFYFAFYGIISFFRYFSKHANINLLIDDNNNDNDDYHHLKTVVIKKEKTKLMLARHGKPIKI